jgi:hypothetical protein
MPIGFGLAVRLIPGDPDAEAVTAACNSGGGVEVLRRLGSGDAVVLVLVLVEEEQAHEAERSNSELSIDGDREREWVLVGDDDDLVNNLKKREDDANERSGEEVVVE